MAPITYLGLEVVSHPRKGNFLQGESQGEYSSPRSTWPHCDSCAHLADSGYPELLAWQWPQQTHNFLQQHKMCNRKKKKTLNAAASISEEELNYFSEHG